MIRGVHTMFYSSQPHSQRAVPKLHLHALRRSPHSAAILLAALVFSTLATATVEADELDIQGNWEVLSFFRDGASRPSNEGYNGVLIYDDNISFDNFRFQARTLKYRIDSKKTPIQLDVLDEQSKDVIQMAIVNLEGDHMQICIGRQRPLSFRTVQGDGTKLFVLRRTANE